MSCKDNCFTFSGNCEHNCQQEVKNFCDTCFWKITEINPVDGDSYESYTSFIAKITRVLNEIIRETYKFEKKVKCEFCNVWVAIKSLRRELQEVLKEICKIKKRLDLLEKRVTNLEAAMAALQERVTLVEKDIKDLYNKYATLKDEINDIYTTIASILNRLTKLETTVANHETRIKALEQCCADVKHRLDLIEQDLANIHNQINNITNDITNIHNEINNIWNVINEGGGGGAPSGHVRIFKYSVQTVVIPWSQFTYIDPASHPTSEPNLWFGNLDNNQPFVLKNDMTGILNCTFTCNVIENLPQTVWFSYQNARELSDRYIINFDTVYKSLGTMLSPSQPVSTDPPNMPNPLFKFPASDGHGFPPSQVVAAGIYVNVAIYGYKDVPLA